MYLYIECISNKSVKGSSIWRTTTSTTKDAD